MNFVYSDGGRSKYFKAKNVRDCVTRAICNATGKDYLEVYKAINQLAKNEFRGKRKRGISSARNGVYKRTYTKYLKSIGWEFKPTCAIGLGSKTYLNSRQMPIKGTYIVSIARHLTCLKDDTIYDTFDCTKGGKAKVYGYFVKVN